MPCKYCKSEKFENSSTHTLSKCVAPVDSWVGPIEELWLNRACDLSYQREVLMSYSQVRLLKVCMMFNVAKKISYTKEELSMQIIAAMSFDSYIFPNALRLSVEERSLVDVFYNSNGLMHEIELSDERSGYQNRIETYYDMYLGSRYARRVVQCVVNAASTRISVNRALQDVSECGICLEEKNVRMRFGCLHDFCSDCVTTLCETKCNGNRRVSCPMCRANVSLYQTPNQGAYYELARLMSRLGVRDVHLYESRPV
jgi:hypothetical protein